MNQRAGSEPFFSEPLPDTPWPADFVLCRFDLSIVAVIELDDQSHERADRRGADARKNKALADAGIRLVRIPAGALPSEDALRALVDADGTAGAMSREETVLRLVETVETFEDRESPAGQRREVKKSRVLRNLVLKAALGGVLKQATRPLAARHIAPASAVPQAMFATRPSGEAVAATRRPKPSDTKTLQKQKGLAWAAAYSAPTSCEHPADWNAQVECGNRYMRAKEKFEAQWAAEHGLGRVMQPVVLSNASLDSAPH